MLRHIISGNTCTRVYNADIVSYFNVGISTASACSTLSLSIEFFLFIYFFFIIIIILMDALRV